MLFYIQKGLCKDLLRLQGKAKVIFFWHLIVSLSTKLNIHFFFSKIEVAIKYRVHEDLQKNNKCNWYEDTISCLYLANNYIEK